MIQLQGSWRTAVGTNLDDWCAIRGVYRRQATFSVRVGTFNVEIPEGTRFSTLEGGIIFVSGKQIEGINYQYQLTCESTGQIGNSYVGDLLAIDYVNGLESATIGDIIIAGEDEETDDSLRERFTTSMQQQAFGGNLIAYKEKIESIDGVGLCQIYPADQYQGGSTALCVIIDSQYNLASQTLIDIVQEEIAPIYDGNITNGGYGFAPIGAKITIQTGTLLDIDIACTIQVSSGQPSDYQTQIENKIKEYIQDVMSSWALMRITNVVSYVVTLFRARIIQYILEIENIINVTNLTINSEDEDLVLTESSSLQQVATFGSLTLNE